MKKTLVLSFIAVLITALRLSALDTAELDSYIESALEENHIPGAVLAIVYEGETVFLKGYGISVVETGEEVDPVSTRFRIGSVTKLFTFTALMQLVEKGLVDLNSPVNEYIDFELPNKYGREIIVSDLMNHTAGFEERVYNLQARNREDVEGLEEWVRENIPGQVREPGTEAAYSNYGVTLIGYMIQHITGMTFDEYLEKNILAPLKMEHTTFTAEELLNRPGLTGSYDIEDGNPVPGEMGFWNIGPAGSISSSGSDMAAFILAHLQGAEGADPVILKKETMDLMHSRSFSAGTDINGMAHGFIEGSFGGYDYIWHGGSTVYNHSNLTLFPEIGLGVFISANSISGGALTGDIQKKMIELVLPERPGNEPEKYSGPIDATRFTGVYHMNRSNYTTSEKLSRFQSSLLIRADKDELVIGGVERYAPIAPLRFRNIDTGSVLIFEENERGKISRCREYNTPILSYEKQMGLSNIFIHLGVILFIILFCLITLIVQIVKHRKFLITPLLLRIMILLSVAGIIAVFIATGLNSLMFSEVGLIKTVLWFSPLVVCATLFALISFSVRLWKKSDEMRISIVEVSTIACAILYSGLLFYWNAVVPVF